MKPFLTIIAPVYNVEKYLPDFIRSVLIQDFTDFELILVDDCSTDGSYSVCESYAKKDNRIQLLRQPQNKGCAAARNAALSVARGEYLMFVDPDDYLSENAISFLVKTAKETSSDIVYGSYNLCYESSGKIVRKKLRNMKSLYTHEEAVKCFLNFRGLYGYPWGKLYKKQIVSFIFPEDMKAADDSVFSFNAIWCANSVAFLDKPVYNYRIRNDSLSNWTQDFTDKNLQCFQQFKYIKEIIGECKRFENDLKIFEFIIHLMPLIKYQHSAVEVKEKFRFAYDKMKKACDESYMMALLHSCNIRYRICAIKYALKKFSKE